MHIFWIVVLGLIALAWIASVIDLAIGVRTMPWLRDAAPLEDAKCPSVSILFAGRDERKNAGKRSRQCWRSTIRTMK